MPINILIVTEGATERVVGKALYERKLLNQNGVPKPPNWKSYFGQSQEGYDQVIEALAQLSLSSGQRVLLIFDQEGLPTPLSRAELIAQDLARHNPFWRSLSWTLLRTHRNLFKAQVGGACILLHVSDATAPNIANKDFDGYILQLLNGTAKEAIASNLIPFPASSMVLNLLQKAEDEFTHLMETNGFPWQRNKAWLYAYITAFQFRQSHVWFAKRVVESAPDNELRRVFASLIHAWDWLVRHGGVCS